MMPVHVLCLPERFSWLSYYRALQLGPVSKVAAP